MRDFKTVEKVYTHTSELANKKDKIYGDKDSIFNKTLIKDLNDYIKRYSQKDIFMIILKYEKINQRREFL